MLGSFYRWYSQVDPREENENPPEEGSSKGPGSGLESASSFATISGDEFEVFGDQLKAMMSDGVKLHWWDLWALGVSTAIGGHFFIWNVGYIAGFGSYVIAYFIIASGYAMLALCMAELAGALPFAGGAYGITRVTLGTLPGFLVGCFDSYQSIFNVILNTLAMAIIITFAAEIDAKWEPLWWFLIYVSYMIIHIIGNRLMWRVMIALSLGSVILLMVYLLGSARFANFEENAPLFFPVNLEGDQKWFQGGVRLFLKTLPFPSWFFIGTESINLASHDAVNPKRDVPRAYLLTFATVLCTSCAMFFMVPSVYPGTTLVSRFIFPTVYGYMAMFNCDLPTAIAIGFAALYTSGFGFTYYYSSQVRAMGKSGLVNPWLGYDIPIVKTPVPALIFGMLIGMLVGLRYYFFKALPYEDLISINLLGATATYCSQFISFIVFRLYYPTIKREFVSPLGIAGAVYGLMVFLLMFIVVAGFENKPAIEVFAIYIGLLLLYYVLVVRHRQTFSEEEKTVLFKAYLIKSNRSKNARIRTGAGRMPLSSNASRAGSRSATPLIPLRSTVYKPSPSSTSSDTGTAGNLDSIFSFGTRSRSLEEAWQEERGVQMMSPQDARRHQEEGMPPGLRLNRSRSDSYGHSSTMRYLEVPTIPELPEFSPASGSVGIASVDITPTPQEEEPEAALAGASAAALGGGLMGGPVSGSVKTEGDSNRARMMDNLVDDIELGRAHYVWSAARGEYDDDALGLAQSIYALPNDEGDSVMGAVWYGEAFGGSQAPSTYTLTLTPHTNPNRFSLSTTAQTPVVMPRGYSPASSIASAALSAHTAVDPGATAPNTAGATSLGFYSPRPFSSAPTPSMRTALDPGSDTPSSEDHVPPGRVVSAALSHLTEPSPQESEDSGD